MSTSLVAATLGIQLDAHGAIRQIDLLQAKFLAVGKAGEDAAGKISGSLGSSLGGMERTAGSAHMGLSRLTRGIETLAVQASGANPVVGKLGIILGEMAIGGPIVTGVLAGVAAIGIAYDHLTKGAREAAKAQSDLVKSLRDENDAARVGPGSKDDLKYQAELKNRHDLRLRRDTLQQYRGPNDSEVLSLNAQIAESQKNLDEYTARLAARNPLPTVSITGRDFGAEMAKAQANTIRYNELMEQIYGNLGKVGHDFSHGAGERATARAVAGMTTVDIPEFVMPKVGVNDGLTKEQIRIREKMGILVDHTDMVRDAVLTSANIIGSSISSALNVGGGRGGALGGALGSGVGSILGAGLTHGAGAITSGIWGIVGGVAGGVVGSVIGSAIGSLFGHHQHAINKNTDALDRNTAAQLLNAPGGYKVAGIRYRADDGRYIYNSMAQASRMRAMRGGTAGALV